MMIFIFDKQEELRAILSNQNPASCPFWADLFTQHIENGLATHEFELPADHDDAQLLEVNGYTAIRGNSGALIPFKIRSIEDRTDGSKIVRRVFAENAGMELLDDIVRPMTLNGVSLQQAMENILAGTRWKPGKIEWSGVMDLEVSDYDTVMKVALGAAAQWGGEVYFRIEMDGARIVDRFVDILQARGSQDGFGVKRFEYSKDITGIIRTESTEDLITAVIGVGKADENSADLTFANIDKTLTNDLGNSVRKPQGADFVGDPDALQQWGIDGKHRIGVFKDTEETVADRLLDNAWNWLQKMKYPKMTYEMDVVLLKDLANYADEDVQIGDKVTIVDHMFTPAVVLTARVLELEMSQTDPKNDKVKLGNFTEVKAQDYDVIASLQRLIQQKQSVWELTGEVITKAPTPPTNPIDGQLWLDTTDSALNVLKKYDATSGSWIKATPTEAADIGAATPVDVQNMSEAERLRGQKIILYKEKTAIDDRYSFLIASTQMYTQSIKTELQSAKTDLDAKYTALTNSIDAAVADNSITDAERSDLETKTEDYRLAVARFEKAYAAGQDDIADGKAADAEAAATDFTQNYANKKITQGSVAPSNPVTGDLWIDTTSTPNIWKRWDGSAWTNAVPTKPEDIGAEKGITKSATAPANPKINDLWLDTSGSLPVWKRWDGSAWNKLTLTDLSELAGQLATNQLQDGVVTKDKLADGAVGTNQLEAGAISEQKMRWSTHLIF